LSLASPTSSSPFGLGPNSKSPFGIDVATVNTGSGSGASKDSVLRCFIIPGGDDSSINPSALILFFQLVDANFRSGSWGEKTLYDMVKQNHPSVAGLGISAATIKLFLDNVPQLNGRGYAIRGFVIHANSVPAKDSALNLGRHICSVVNAHPDNNTTTSLIPDGYFMSQSGGVWADAVGHQESLKMLIKKTINQVPQPGFYEMYHHVIHSHFRSGGLTLDLARALHAPMDQVDPSERPAVPMAGVEVETVAEDDDEDDEEDGN
jgi:hypothetical protein